MKWCRSIACSRLWQLVLGLAVAPSCAGVVEDPGSSPVEPNPGNVGGNSSASLGGSSGNTSVAPGQGGANGGSTASAGSPSTGMDCVNPNPGSAPLRRLSNAEYRNSLRDLFKTVNGMDAEITSATQGLPAEAESLGFRNSAEFLTVQPLLAQNYESAAERLAAKAASTPGFVPCTPKPSEELACAKQLITKFGKAAYRRSLSSAESARYEAMFQSGFKEKDFTTGIEWVVLGMLQSPGFLYRAERGVAGTPTGSSGGPRQLSGYEMASRLSYLFWQSAPDEALLALAEGGAFATPQAVEKQARAMLADSRADRLFEYFAEWLDLDHLDEFARDASVFPNLPTQLPDWYRQETQSFVRALLSNPQGSLNELLTAPYTYANKGLASHYGLTGPTGDAFVRVDDARRSGVLTQAMLMSRDKPYRTSIVRRGLKIRTDFLCQNVPAPPNDVQLNLDSAAATLSQRDRLAQHRKDPSCAACHNLLDPIGVVFENFDAVGRYREKDELNQSIDTSSELNATRDSNGPIGNVRELGASLARSAEVQDCYVKQSFRFFFGREVEAADACSMAQLQNKFRNTNQSLSELLVALTQTDAFLYLPPVKEVAP
ncbi:MAG TPA: DUF1592 domain-containing protein [Polyangiaceae bacterium]|nr:DUF1592 domain-containing protein [Polyangiaceae bacterium]